jgi:molybdenum cofactor cytidylyltransferase
MNESDMTMNRLFDPPPEQWGLRGDPCLWEATQEHLTGIPIPDNKQTLKLVISDAFATLTGQAITSDDEFFLELCANGGISPAFWRKQRMDSLINNWSTLLKTS